MASSFGNARRVDWVRVALRVFLGAAVAYLLAPLVIVVINSLNSTAYNLIPPPSLTVRWYVHLFQLSQFGSAIRVSIEIAAVTAVTALLIGSPAALVLTRHQLRWADGWRAFLTAPIVIPQIVFGLAMFIFFLGLGLNGTVVSIVLTHLVVALPFVVIVMGAAFLDLDPALEEAAMDLGARIPQVAWCVMLPQVRLPLLAAGAFAFIISFDQLETTLFLVRPGMTTLPVQMFLYMETFQDPTMAALSTLLILGVAAGLVIFDAIFQRRPVGALGPVGRAGPPVAPGEEGIG
ncbi:MAG TPA: ABC transporter permease [bacterium]|nr:ABC transporter permease [bacterium]